MAFQDPSLIPPPGPPTRVVRVVLTPHGAYPAPLRERASSFAGLPSDRFYRTPATPLWSRAFHWIGQGLSAMNLLVAFFLLAMVVIGVGPLFFGFRPFVVLSGSMEPTIPTGSIAITRPVPSDQLQIGDVIALAPKETALPILHRIVQIENRKGTLYYTTRGDANNENDAEFALPATALQLVGAIPLVGYVVYAAAQPLGTVLLVWLPLLALVTLWLKDRVVQVWRWANTRGYWTVVYRWLAGQ